MIFKSIDIFGFKSFAKKSKIVLDDAIIGLVGPNGCGKSNIVDAIKWALGIQSMRELRATRAEELIFDGSDAHPPLNFAEVTLHIDNSEKFLSLDAEEIEIKRRAYRSGETECFINRRQVRPKEVRTLFFDTGVGKSAYSTIEQGKIGHILQSRPEERRIIFEEAASIRRSREQTKEAEQQLERMERNLIQVLQIFAEVEQNHTTLKQQAENTTHYRKLHAALSETELQIRLGQIEKMDAEKVTCTEQFKKLEQKKQEIVRQIETQEHTLRQHSDKITDIETNFATAQKFITQLDLDYERIKGRIEQYKERMAGIKAQITREETRLEWERTRWRTMRQEITQKEQSTKELTSRLDECREDIKRLRTTVDTYTTHIEQNKNMMKNLHLQIADDEKEQQTERQQIATLTDDIGAQLDQRLKDSHYSPERRTHLEKELLHHLEQLTLKLKGSNAIASDMERSSGAAMAQIEKLHAYIEEGSTQLHHIEQFFAEYMELIPPVLDEFLAPTGIVTHKRDLDMNVEQRQRRIEEAREKIVTLNDDNNEIEQQRAQSHKNLTHTEVLHGRIETQYAEHKKDIARSTRQLEELGRHQQEIETTITHDRNQLIELEKKIEGAVTETEESKEQKNSHLKELQKLRTIASDHNTEMKKIQTILTAKQEELGQLQPDYERLQRTISQIEAKVEAIYTDFKEYHSIDLHTVRRTQPPIGTDLAQLQHTRRNLVKEIEQLGPVNLMAIDEFNQVAQRHEFLQKEITDLRDAKKDLSKVTENIFKESTKMFVHTFEVIRKNFHQYFRQLFGGGRANLILTTPDQPLESGIDIIVHPPGGTSTRIESMSGGEQTLTALALLFATHAARPAPFCILDEADAALDEANIGRFLALLTQFSSTTQFIIVSHNKKTISAVSTLIGITMEEQGVSKLITLRMPEHVNIAENA